MASSIMITMLGWSVVLLLAHIVLQAGTAGDLGPAYLFSPRDEERQTSSIVSRRLKRALYNYLETYAGFVALAIALHVTGKTGGLASTGALLWFFARVAYLPIYALGIPAVRTGVWTLSIIGLILMLIALWA